MMASPQSDLFDRLASQGATAPERGLQSLLIELVEQIEQTMQEQGLTRAEVGRRAGLKREYISRILNNPQNVTLATLVRIANALSQDLSVNLQPRVTRPRLAARPRTEVHGRAVARV